MKQIVMQFKREFWELKHISFNAPFAISATLTGLACAWLLLITFSGNLQFSITDQVMLSAKSNNKITLLFDSEQADSALSEVEREFKWLASPVLQSNPELIRYEYENLNDTKRYHKPQHALKDDIENRITQTTDLFELMLMGLLIIPLTMGLVANKKDQSLLFWRSLPVSDFQIITTKFIYVFLVIPCIYLLATYLGLSLFLILWTVIEMAKSSADIVAVYPVAWMALVELGMLAPAFFFKLFWFLPAYALLLAMFMLVSRYKSLPAIMPAFVMLILAVERMLFDTPWLNNTIKEYFSSGLTHSQHIKWTVLWGDNFPPVDYSQLTACIVAAILLIAAVIKLRQKQQA
ncbi:ABC transporter permease [Catenovulum agarivorans DS-2]|uniref:ABC transporter permease n=1 Tax=Catenovulum agarivorans DS-2 TaxID=1328313 RepID=W7QJR9_9ALTE|nr:hypothetical protein [Catenovulum agarivorans]EWH08383.1 ABC transporter permease [Catenovulum agarivorans DS-2]